MKKILPILDWLPKYKKIHLKGDIIAGLTVSIILIPQGIAYAMIAGLPPIYGLYCALVPQFIYVLFGTSRQVSVGPIAMDSLIVATGVSALALRASDSYINIALLLGMIVGIIQLSMGIFKLGFVVNFLSKPVLSGFASAVALLIGLNQFKHLLGFEVGQSDEIVILIGDIIEGLQNIQLQTTIIGLICCSIIYISKKINRKIPNALITVILGIVLIKFFPETFSNVEIVGKIPAGLPSFTTPKFDFTLIKELIPTAITLVIIGYLELYSIGKTLEHKQNEYRVSPSQELIALGLANTIGAFFKSYIATSSFSRSAINQESGGKTGVSAIITIIMVIITLFFLTPVFAYLPKTVLASIIIIAVFNLIQVSEAKRLYRINRFDFWLMITTFIATLYLNIQYGILVGVILSLFVLIYRTSNPAVVELGKVPNSNFYKNAERFDDVILDNDILVFRFDAQLFYANADYFREKLEKMSLKKASALKLIVFDAESVNRIDSTAIDMLIDRVKYYKRKNVFFYFAGVKGNVRDSLYKADILEIITRDHFFMRVNDAVQFHKTGDNESQKKYAKYINS